MAKNTYKQDEVLEEPFDIRHLLRASSYIKKYAGRMVVAILLSGIGGAFGYVAPMIIQRALDLAIPDKNEKLLFSLVGMLVGIYVVSVIFTTIRSRIMVDVSQNIIYDIRKDLFEHLQELPFQYYDDRPHGKILIRVVNYVNSVSDMLSNGLINIVLECFNLLFIVIFMFLVDVQMALVVLCGVPVLCVFMVWIKNKQRRAWQAVSNKNSNLNAYLQENIVGARITQIFAREDENAEIFKDLSQDCRRTWNTAALLLQSWYRQLSTAWLRSMYSTSETISSEEPRKSLQNSMSVLPARLPCTTSPIRKSFAHLSQTAQFLSTELLSEWLQRPRIPSSPTQRCSTKTSSFSM